MFVKNKYYSAVKTLLKKEKDKKKPKIYFLSAYLPTKNYFKNEIRLRLKSLILEGFRSNAKLKKQNWLHHKIIAGINGKVGGLKDLGQGLAVFVKFSSKEHPKIKTQRTVGESSIFILRRAPKKEIYIGKTFDLDQIVWLDNISITACIISLGRKTCEIYTLDKNNFELFSEEKNKFIKEKEKEYFEEYKGVRYTTGYNKIKRKQKRENQRFLNQIIGILQTHPTFRTGIEYLLIFHSVGFSEFIEDSINESKRKFPKTKVFLVPKNIKHEKKLKQETTRLIKSKQKMVVKELLKKTKSHPKLYVKGWKKVTKASRMRKIEVLFIDPLINKKGYLYKKEIIYTYPIKKSKYVRDIAPWIVRNVIRFGGKIVVLESRSNFIAAKLRY